MNRKIIITKLNEKIVTSLYEDDVLAEIHCYNESEKQDILGNIYVGRVKSLAPNIDAAFVEIQGGQECYFSVSENKAIYFTHKIGKKPLCIGDELLVQVSKEAVKTKVPTVTSKLSFTGKYCVLTVGDCRIAASGKLKKAVREELIALATPYQTEDYGIIMRTNAGEAPRELLMAELESLTAECKKLLKTANTRSRGSCLKSAPKGYLTDLKNIYQDGLSDIVIEDISLYNEIYGYLEEHQPEDISKLRRYQDSLLPLHKLYGTEKALRDAVKERVWLKSGAYLIIQPTEALTVIDVNSGKCVGKKRDDKTWLKFNLEAAKEAARQIRLRNLSGIILIDFINMDSEACTEELLTFLRRELEKDPISTTLVDMTKLQLVEITRKK